MKETIREILSGAELTDAGTLGGSSLQTLRAVADRLDSGDAGAPLEIVQVLHGLPDGEHGALMLVEAAKSPKADVRRNAVIVMGMLRCEWAVPLLKRAAEDSDASVRRAALHSLAGIDPAGSRFLFLLGLKDAAWEVRAEAAAGLAALADPATLKYLTRSLKEKDEFTLYKIVDAIHSIAGEENTPLFQDMLSRPETRVHAEVATLVLAKNGVLQDTHLLRDLLAQSKNGWHLFGVKAYAKMDANGALELARESATSNPSLSAALTAAVRNSNP